MVFSNLIFLYLFLPVCLIAYFFCPGIRAKNAVLILFSLIFYAWGEPFYIFLLLLSSLVNYVAGLLIENHRAHGKAIVAAALVFDLGMLAVFKYAGFFVENINALFGVSIPVPDIVMPIGILGAVYAISTLAYVLPQACVVMAIVAIYAFVWNKAHKIPVNETVPLETYVNRVRERSEYLPVWDEAVVEWMNQRASAQKSSSHD